MQLKEGRMFETKLISFENPCLPKSCNTPSMYADQYNQAISQFRSMFFKGELSRLLSKVLRRPHWLYDLNALKPNLHVQGGSYSGIQVVKISSIIGSEGKTADFDMDFHPIKEAARERWVNMAMVYLARLPLPPIQLIRVGEAYFVRDGHHRISVSRAFGQIAMDAEVITWRAAPPFPWQADGLSKQQVSLKIIHTST